MLACALLTVDTAFYVRFPLILFKDEGNNYEGIHI